MIDISGLVAICEGAAGLATKALEAYRSQKLSPEEKELLAAAVETGTFKVIRGSFSI